MAELSLPEQQVNPALLQYELQTALGGEWGVIGRKGQWYLILPDGHEKDEAAALAIAQAHNPDGLSPEEAKQARQQEVVDQARTEVAKIPAWATMTEAEAVASVQNTVTDLASAKAALVLMARMIVHLRDAVWQGLGEEDAQRG